MATQQPIYNNLGDDSPTKKKLISKIRERFPNLDEKEVISVLIGVKRFVNVVKKMRTEPQLQVIYKDEEIDGKIQKNRIIQTDIEELKKVVDEPKYPITKAMEKLKKYLPKK